MIRKVKARNILDFRGQPTLEVDLFTEIGMFRSSVPNDSRENPLGFKQLRENAVDIVNNIIGPELVNAKIKIDDQKRIDEFLVRLDGTDDKSKLGSIAMYGVSSGVCKAGASKKELPFARYISKLADNKQFEIPVPAFSVIGGGRFANNYLSFLDYVILPLGADNFEEAYKIGNEIYRAVEKKIAELDELNTPLPTNAVGAFIPQSIEDDAAAVGIIDEIIQNMGYENKVKIQINADASNFFDTESSMYNFDFKSNTTDFPEEPNDIKEIYTNLISTYPNLVSIEDPFSMHDIDSWPLVMDQQRQIICNELGAMNPDVVQNAIDKNAANCLVIEPWRAGTITESLIIVKMANFNGWKLSVSAGYGKTEDNFIAHYAVGISSNIFNAGAPINSINYNQLLRIEKELDKTAKYAGSGLKLPIE